MRLGVSAKIFVAYTALAVVFAASSASTLVYMHRARERVVASQLLFDIQSDLDASWRALNDFPQKSVRRPDPRRSLALVKAQTRIETTLEAMDRHLETASSLADAPDLPRYRREVAGLSVRIAKVATGLGLYEAGEAPGEKAAFISRLTQVTYRLDRVKRAVRAESRRLATALRVDEENARTLAMGLAGVGVLVALLVALSMMRTLRPLRVLRERARAVAGGDYSQPIRVESRDEIGDLAREFDAMAVAVKEREGRLVQSERLATIGQMAAHITHEIRNPLASIGLNAELLMDDLKSDPDEAQSLVKAIAAEVDRLSDITETYLKFVRMPRGEKAPEDLGAIVSSVLAFARAELQRAKVELSIDIEPDLPEVAADEGQIRQALLNLVRNAREAMGEGGRMEVTLRRGQDNTVVLRICDDGPGIPCDDKSRIFDPFFSTKEKGTGLGLALVQQIVSEHNGRILATDAPLPAGGTVFEIVMPTLDAQRAASSPPDALAG